VDGGLLAYAKNVLPLAAERETTLNFDVVLKSVQRCDVDCYSIIAYYKPEALSAFLKPGRSLTDEEIIAFIVQHLTTDCAQVFEITNSSDWMQLHQFHLQSVHCRNDVFSALVSGYFDTYPISDSVRRGSAPSW
jgi:hypothetical protein